MVTLHDLLNLSDFLKSINVMISWILKKLKYRIYDYMTCYLFNQSESEILLDLYIFTEINTNDKKVNIISDVMYECKKCKVSKYMLIGRLHKL